MIFLLIYLILSTIITACMAVEMYGEFKEGDVKVVLEALGPAKTIALITICSLIVMPFVPIVMVCAMVYYGIHQ